MDVELKSLMDAEEAVHRRMIELEKENPAWARVFLDDEASWQRFSTGTMPTMPPEYKSLIDVQADLLAQIDARQYRLGYDGPSLWVNKEAVKRGDLNKDLTNGS